MTKAGLLVALALYCLSTAPAPAVVPQGCPPLSEIDPSDTAVLPHLAAALKPGATLDILVIGAGPDVKPAAANGTPGFPGQLTRDLESGLRGLRVTATVRSGRGLLAPAQLGLIRTALAQHRYQLVLWQTGTTDAVQGDPVEDFSQALADGADAVDAAGADLILVEPQFSRFLEANADLGPYLSAMAAAGAEPGSLVFHRYALMHDWVNDGLIDLEYALPSERPAVAARLHACLAAELAHLILAQAETKPPAK